LFLIAVGIGFDNDGSAYSNAKMTDEVFTKIRGRWMDSSYNKFINHDGSVVVQLKKALYGCKQSSLLGFKEMRKTLEKEGFTSNPYDQCVFSRMEHNGAMTILLYVDDLFIFAPAEEQIYNLAKVLENEYEEVKVHVANQLDYLGMVFNFHQGMVTVNMKGYVEKILEEMNVTGEANTPAAHNLFEVGDEALVSEAKQQSIHHSYSSLPLELVQICSWS
jgi:hypothetical protein